MAITINGKVYRNLEDQVQYLTEQFQAGKLVEELGIHVLGVYTTIEDIPSEDYRYGDAYLIGTTVPYNLYVYTDLQEKGDKFIDVGVFPAVGEKGDKGDKGDTGEKGERGPKGDTGPRGYTGEKGDTGAVGSQGPQGLTGAKGDKGDVGPAFNIVATLETTSQLPTPTIEMQDEGKCYLIPVDGVNHVYCIQGDTAANVKWIDFGTSGIQGPKGDDGKDGVGLDSYIGFNEGTYNSTSGSVTNTGIQYQQQSNIMYLDETVQTVQVNNQHKLPIVADNPTSITYNSDDKVFHITTDLSAKADKTELETLQSNIQDNLNNNYFTKTEVNNTYLAKAKVDIAQVNINTTYTFELPNGYLPIVYIVNIGNGTLAYNGTRIEIVDHNTPSIIYLHGLGNSSFQIMTSNGKKEIIDKVSDATLTLSNITNINTEIIKFKI